VGGPGGSSSSRRAASPVPLHWSPAHQTACQGRAKRRPCLRARPPPRGCTPPQQGTQRPSSLTCAAGVDASCGVRYSTASHAVRASRGWIFSSLASCAAASSDSCSCLEAAAAASAAPASLLLAAPAERRGCAAAAAAAAASAAAPAAPTAAAAMSVSHLQPRMASTSIFSRTRCRLSDGSSASAHAVPQPPHGHVGVLFHPPAPCCHAGHPPPPRALLPCQRNRHTTHRSTRGQPLSHAGWGGARGRHPSRQHWRRVRRACLPAHQRTKRQVHGIPLLCQLVGRQQQRLADARPLVGRHHQHLRQPRPLGHGPRVEVVHSGEPRLHGTRRSTHPWQPAGTPCLLPRCLPARRAHATKTCHGNRDVRGGYGKPSAAKPHRAQLAAAAGASPPGTSHPPPSAPPAAAPTCRPPPR